jgi:hypothetical protein
VYFILQSREEIKKDGNTIYRIKEVMNNKVYLTKKIKIYFCEVNIEESSSIVVCI